jgi:predicted Zn-dependent protease
MNALKPVLLSLAITVAVAGCATTTSPTGRTQYVGAVSQQQLNQLGAQAFALPGGKVGVYTGIFSVARNQDQLAGVLAHEIAHVVARHHDERLTRQAGASGALQVVSALLGSRYGSGVGSAAAQGGSVLAQTGFLLPGSRQQEVEADVLGQRLMAEAGFDPRGAVSLWQNMVAVSQSRPPEFLSTHPNPSARIGEMQTRATGLLPVYERARAAGRRPNCG